MWRIPDKSAPADNANLGLEDWNVQSTRA